MRKPGKSSKKLNRAENVCSCGHKKTQHSDGGGLCLEIVGDDYCDCEGYDGYTIVKEAAWSIKEAKRLVSKSIGVMGGHFDEFPGPVVRFFDDKRRRRGVKITCSVFPGIGKHYHVDIWEEDDAILDRTKEKDYRDKPVWRRCWDDRESKGMGFHDKFDSESDAAHFAVNTWKKEFSSKTHKLDIRSRWLKKRMMELMNQKRT